MESRVRASEWIIESSDSPQPAAALGWEARIATASLADDGDRVQANSSAGVRWSSAAACSRACSAVRGLPSQNPPAWTQPAGGPVEEESPGDETQPDSGGSQTRTGDP